MIDVVSLKGRTVAVLGLGRAGTAAARALRYSGAEVWAWDDDAEARAVAAGDGTRLVDLATCDWNVPAAMVLSPGIPHTHPQPHPVVERARDAGCEVIGDVELLARTQREARYIGITGTNGKSTTTALIGHVLATLGQPIQVGGNLGLPALAMEPLGAGGTYVLEMSSYQLEISRSVAFDVAVLLNITPDHLDRHGGMAGYVAAKKLIFQGQPEGATAIVGIDDDTCRAIFAELARHGRRAVPISAHGRAPGGCYVVEGMLYEANDAGEKAVLDLGPVATLPGAHNWQNAAAAYAAMRAVKTARERIVAAMRSYPGLPHRQERIEVVDGILYVNDSKATNADAAAKALACYDAIYWIAGGLPKEGGLAGLEQTLGRVRHAFLVGQAAADFEKALDGKVATTRSGDIATAVRQARARALADGIEGAVVLLSPACASFDQFDNFEARGETFRSLVMALPGKRGAA